MPDPVKRCAWVSSDPIYLAYHDTEWGVPVRDDRRLFQFLVLEGTQAGLSWLTILKRRQAFRRAFDGFDPEAMARWDDERLARLMQDRSIIRNLRKLEAARKNARAFLKVQEEPGSFSRLLWSFVDGKPIQNAWSTAREVPAHTPLSKTLSRELKKRNFSFVGPTICYAFMQAVGMVNDHTTDCFRYSQIRKLS